MTPAHCRPRLHRLAAVCLLLWGTAGAQADEGIPALLQFAEQYRDQAPPSPTEGKTQKTQTRPSQAASVADASALRRTLGQREAQLATAGHPARAGKATDNA
ncbi:hypothetical protein BSR04_05325, partial [Serratia plymuthica]